MNPCSIFAIAQASEGNDRLREYEEWHLGAPAGAKSHILLSNPQRVGSFVEEDMPESRVQ